MSLRKFGSYPRSNLKSKLSGVSFGTSMTEWKEVFQINEGIGLEIPSNGTTVQASEEEKQLRL